MNIVLEPGASALLDALHRAGFAAYAVGGCVRDSLLGLAPHDWDLCTAARPEQVMELFGEKQCIPTGLQHGTVTVKRDGKLYEITTFRTEGSYSDGRHPDSVAFVPDVREDLARRDFTINAMPTAPKRACATPLAGRKIWPGAWCGPSVSRCAALKKTLCASCVSTALRPGSVLLSTRPPKRRRSSWPPTSTACRWSASKKS